MSQYESAAILNKNRRGDKRTLTGRELTLRILDLGLVPSPRRIAGLLVPELHHSADEDLAVPYDGPDRGFALEDRLERVAVRDQRGEVGALRGRACGKELREANRDVLQQEVRWVNGFIRVVCPGRVCWGMPGVRCARVSDSHRTSAKLEDPGDSGKAKETTVDTTSTV